MRLDLSLALTAAVLLVGCTVGQSDVDTSTTSEDLPGQPPLPDVANVDITAPGDLWADTFPAVDASVQDATSPGDLHNTDALAESVSGPDSELPSDGGYLDDGNQETYTDTLLIDDAGLGDLPEDILEPYGTYHPQAPCGMSDYQWMPPEDMGQLVEYSEKLLYHLPPEFLVQMVHEAGYPLELPFIYGTRVYEVRYTTQDRGQMVEATAMVGIPELTQPDTEPGEFPTALFLHGTTGFADKCAPSTGLEGAAAALLPAAMGFIGVAPDYIGMCGFGAPCPEQFHPYLIGEATAIASLDAVRAAHRLMADNLDSLGAVPDSRLVPWGGSQGGHAALFVDRLAPHYAPEFDVPCVIALVPPADLAQQASVALQSLGSAASLGTGFLAAAYLWYDPPTPSSALFNPDGPKDYSEYVLETFVKTCSSNALVKGSSSLWDVYTESFLQDTIDYGLGSVEPWGCFAQENSLTTTSVPYASDAQVYYVIAENDNIVNNDVARQTFLDMCELGYEMEFVECNELGHTDAAVQSILMQVDWAQRCLAGEVGPADGLCQLKEPETCVAF